MALICAFSSSRVTENHHPESNADPYDVRHFLPIGTLEIPTVLPASDCADHWHMYAIENEPELVRLASPEYKSLIRGLKFLTVQKFIAVSFRCDKVLRLRVYLIPFDLAHVEGALLRRNEAAVLNPARKLLRHLFSKLCRDPGSWKESSLSCLSPNPAAGHLLSSTPAMDNQSFVEMYNSLPSPVLRLFDGETHNATSELTDRILRQKIAGLQTNLYDYQRHSVAFMAQKELDPGSCADPLYVSVTGLDGRTFYVQPGTLEVFQNLPTATGSPGGILCEELGTGKTVIILTLILSTIEQLSVPEESILDPRPVLTPLALEYFPSPLFRDVRQKFAHGKQPPEDFTPRIPTLTEFLLHRARTHPALPGVPQTAYSSSLTHIWEAFEHNTPFYHHYDEEPLEVLRTSRNKRPIGPRTMYLTSATLVIVPATLLHQWVNEINKHCDEKMTYLVVEDTAKLPLAQTLATRYDLILMSHTRFAREAGNDRVDKLHTWKPCRCPTLPGTLARVRECKCGNVPKASPLLQIRWKRLVIDEGHVASAKVQETNLMTLAKGLSVQYKWIVTGTPTTNLMGLRFGEGSSTSTTMTDSLFEALQRKVLLIEGEVADDDDIEMGNGERLNVPDNLTYASAGENSDDISLDHLELQYPDTSKDPESFTELQRWTDQDRKDLVKLGNMLGHFLDIPRFSADSTLFSSHVIAPLMHKSGPLPGAVRVLRQVMESVMVRHRVEDVESEVTLPPMQQETVLLDMDPYAVMTYNVMQSSIVINAVDSERTGTDYLLHHDRSKELHQTIENMSQAMFWHVDDMLFHVDERSENANDYMARSTQKLSVGQMTQQDFDMLRKALDVTITAARDPVWRALNMHPNIFSRVYNIPSPIYKAWSSGCLPNDVGRISDSHYIEPYYLMIPDRLKSLRTYLIKKPLSPVPSIIDYGMTVAEEDRYRYQVNMDRARSSKLVNKKEQKRTKGTTSNTTLTAVVGTDSFSKLVETQAKRKALEAEDHSTHVEAHNSLYSSSPMAGVELRNTTSSKLNYILNEVQLYASTAKFLIFSKSPLTLMYIAEAFAVMGIQYKHTIHNLKTLQHDVTTFETSETYRVFLMDLKHGARGLNLISASRVIFCEPVWQADVEAQAIKRVHRIGQVSPVSVKTLAIRHTHEEIILKRRDDLKRGRGSSSGKLPELADDLSMRDFIAHPVFLSDPEPPTVRLHYSLLPSVSPAASDITTEVQSSPLTTRIPPAVPQPPEPEPSIHCPTQASSSAGIIRIPALKRKVPDMSISNGSGIYFQVRKRVQTEPFSALTAKRTDEAEIRPASKNAKPTVRFASP